MLKRSAAVFILIMFLLLLTSCNFDITHISDRLIIEAIGIDKTETGWKISIQALNTKQSNASANSESKEDIATIYSSEGTTVAQAMDTFMIKSGQESLYSQTRVLIFGKKAVEEDISLLLDYFMREYTTRDDTMTVVAYDTAEEIIMANVGESTLGARIIEHEIDNGSTNGLCVKMPIYKFVNLLLGETDAAYTPVVKCEKIDEETDQLKIVGTAVFSGYKLNVFLDTEETTGLMLLNDLIKNCMVSFELDNGVKTAVKIIKNNTKITVSKSDANFEADICSRFSCDIIEYSPPQLEDLTKEKTDEIKAKTSQKAQEMMQKAYDKCVNENNCDITRLGRRIWRKYPDVYSQYLNSKDESLKGIEERITADVTIRDTGREKIIR